MFKEIIVAMMLTTYIVIGLIEIVPIMAHIGTCAVVNDDISINRRSGIKLLIFAPMSLITGVATLIVLTMVMVIRW